MNTAGIDAVLLFSLGQAIGCQEKRFAFDQAFDAETGNQKLFEATTQPLIGAL